MPELVTVLGLAGGPSVLDPTILEAFICVSKWIDLFVVMGCLPRCESENFLVVQNVATPVANHLDYFQVVL